MGDPTLYAAVNVRPSRSHDRSVREIVVVVPAANEQALVGGCLEALKAARCHVAYHYPLVASSVTVVLDGCSDGTEQEVRRYPDVDCISVAARCVGAARGIGAARALARSQHAPDRVWLANTDADSRVPVDWLTALCDAADAGYDAVLGTVRPDLGLPDSVEAEWYRRHDIAEGHPHVHGANFSVRADNYHAVGGWSPLPSGEDDDLATRLVNASASSVLRTARHPVTTSTRTDGRAPRGFSGYLRDLADDVMIESPARGPMPRPPHTARCPAAAGACEHAATTAQAFTPGDRTAIGRD